MAAVQVSSKEESEREEQPHLEHPLPGTVPEGRVEQQTVELLHAPLQQHRLRLLLRRAAPDQLIQHIQRTHHLEQNHRLFPGHRGGRPDTCRAGQTKSDPRT